MYCIACGIDAERPWCPYCGEDMLEAEEAVFMAEERFEKPEKVSRRRRRRKARGVEL